MLVETLPQRAQDGLDLVERVPLVAGGDRRMGGEDRLAAHRLERGGGRLACADAAAQPLERAQGGMPLVQMHDRRPDAERRERPRAAHPEDAVLGEPRVPIELRAEVGDRPIAGEARRLERRARTLGGLIGGQRLDRRDVGRIPSERAQPARARRLDRGARIRSGALPDRRVDLAEDASAARHPAPAIVVRHAGERLQAAWQALRQLGDRTVDVLPTVVHRPVIGRLVARGPGGAPAAAQAVAARSSAR